MLRKVWKRRDYNIGMEATIVVFLCSILMLLLGYYIGAKHEEYVHLMAVAEASPMPLSELNIPVPNVKVDIPPSSCENRTYVVKKGEWLYRIASKEYAGRSYLAHLIAESSGIKNENLIYPGQVLTLPCDLSNLPKRSVIQTASAERKIATKPANLARTNSPYKTWQEALDAIKKSIEEKGKEQNPDDRPVLAPIPSLDPGRINEERGKTPEPGVAVPPEPPRPFLEPLNGLPAVPPEPPPPHEGIILPKPSADVGPKITPWTSSIRISWPFEER